jgi:SLAP domain-containing protein
MSNNEKHENNLKLSLNDREELIASEVQKKNLTEELESFPPINKGDVNVSGVYEFDMGDYIEVKVFIRNGLDRPINFETVPFMLTNSKDELLAYQVFDLKELGIIPPRSARPYKLNFDKKNLKVDKISPDDWKIGFDTRLQAKSYADIEFEGIPDGMSEENRFVLDTFLKGLPRIERGQISFSKFNLALTPEGEFDISIVIRNGADKGINIERIPVKLKDDNDNTVFAAEFTLKDFTISSNKARLVNLKAQSNITSTGTVDLNGCKLLFEK